MYTNQNKYISKIIAPILLGAVVGFLFRVGLFFLLPKIVSNSWEPSYLAIILLAFFLPVGFGSFCTTFFFSATKIIHGIISSIVFAAVIIFPSITMFSIETGGPDDIYKIWLLSFAIILAAGWFGGYIGVVLKKRRKLTLDKLSSPPDTP